MQFPRSFRPWVPLASAALCAFGFGFLSTVWSAPPAERFDMVVRNDFFAGFAGDKEALDRGMKRCEQELAVNPKNPEALVWHGSGLFFLSGASFRAGDREKGMDFSQRGLHELDEAVTLAPRSVAVRVPRGAMFLTSTRFMPKSDQTRALLEKGLNDYELVLDLQKDNFDTMGTHPRGELLFGIAEGYSRLGDQDKAAQFFTRISKELPGTAYADRAALWLDQKSLPPAKTGCIGCHVKQ